MHIICRLIIYIYKYLIILPSKVLIELKKLIIIIDCTFEGTFEGTEGM